MRESQLVSGFGADLRLSTKVVAAILLLVGIVLFVGSDRWAAPADQRQLMSLALLLYLMAPTAWLLVSWRPWMGGWFTISATIFIIFVGHGWLGIPGFLALLAIPTGLAAALIGLPAAFLTALSETALLVLLPRYATESAGPASILVVLILVWATLAMMVAVIRPKDGWG